MVDKEIISKVLALFDEEDIIYIKPNYKEISEKNNKKKEEKIKRFGGKNDRFRK